MLASQHPGTYNEIVIDPAGWVEHMPKTIIGVFYAKAASAAAEAHAREVHARFVRKYSGRRRMVVPLWQYDPTDRNGPFVL